MPTPQPDASRVPPDPATLCARPPAATSGATPPLTPSIHLASVYEIDGLDQIDAIFEGRLDGHYYARDGHPNARQLAAKLAAIEAAGAGLICGSGMAAVSAVMFALLEAGSHVALADSLYGRSTVLAARELSRFGVAMNTFDATRPETLRSIARPGITRLALVETISNPLLRVADLDALAAECDDLDISLVVDHTFAPLLCRPLDHGASLVIHSLTKLVGGHSDVTLGAVLGPAEAIASINRVAATVGLTANPFDCWLALRGLATLSVRVERACANAASLAEFLAHHRAVAAVWYPGLPNHPDHDRARLLFGGVYGNMITVNVGTRERADAVICALHGSIPFAPSLGDTATTLSHPATTSHRGQTPEQWKLQGITPGLIRFSIGIEDVADLRCELKHALDAIA
jgi:cystathionine beta-lyase/cystathionine gamma-synthase